MFKWHQYDSAFEGCAVWCRVKVWTNSTLIQCPFNKLWTFFSAFGNVERQLQTDPTFVSTIMWNECWSKGKTILNGISLILAKCFVVTVCSYWLKSVFCAVHLCDDRKVWRAERHCLLLLLLLLLLVSSLKWNLGFFYEWRVNFLSKRNLVSFQY